ncbi:MAG: endonuclease/exonuclease/phosphatase family protein [Anaerolineaceae bacterium]|nr:endonuclease/exonuclease/phosphatase family protein [Anaerolineaceae bacterium]
MKTNPLRAILFAILFLFFIQLSGTLIESIYILDLLNTTLDEKALGLLFFFAPALLLPVRGRVPAAVSWLMVVLLAVARGVTPFLNTSGRLVSAGVGTALALLLITLLLREHSDGADDPSGLPVSAGLALAGAFSVLLRALQFSLDYSLSPAGGWVGWLLGLGLVSCYLFLKRGSAAPGGMGAAGEVRDFSAGFGLMLVLSLWLFAFASPAVIARWTQANYALIVSAVSLMMAGYAAAAISRADWISQLAARPGWLWGGNLLFSAALVSTIAVHRVAFPLVPNAAPVVVGAPAWWTALPLILMMLLLPVVLVDAAVLLDGRRPRAKQGTPFAWGMLVGMLVLVVLIFMQIFTNVWGYVEPVSPYFRNQFWLPFFLMSALLTLVVVLRSTPVSFAPRTNPRLPGGWLAGLGLVFAVTAGAALWTVRAPQPAAAKSSLIVMTYNIQQANDDGGEKSYLRQLDLIREINPDILALQESDSPRVSLNNNDYVRYYASMLGYDHYYGPTTVTGTYGTAILSRYPLENPRVVFSYSDTDEIGTAEAEVVVGGRRFTIYNVHPDGSDQAMRIFAQTLLDRSAGKENVIALGDYNLRSNEEAFQMIDAVYDNVPGSEGHIDHIFLSSDLRMESAVYLPAPESATDHPLLYAVVTWGE